MEDIGTLKKDVRRKLNKSSNINRIVSLFEISRPNKSKGLQRANSLPASKRPSNPLNGKETASSHTRGSLGDFCSTTGKVQRIKEEIEQKNKRKEVISTPKPVKKKTHSNRRKSEEHVLKPRDWLVDKAKIMEDLNKLQERIEDVTEEIENSDTELEITYRVRKDDHVFERSDGFSYQDILRDKFSEEDSDDALSRLSSDTVFSVASSDTVKEVSQPQLTECDDNFSVNYESSCGFVIVESPEENDEEHETPVFTTHIYLDEPNSKNETESKSTGEHFQEDDSVTEETDNVENVEPEETTEHDIDGTSQNDNSTQINSIEWWKHKSFVQINNEAMSEKINSEPESTENLDTEEASSVKTGRFIKNSNRSSKRERRRTGIIKRPVSVKDLAKHFEGFKDAAESGETENFRKSFIQEMDEELENMRNDGFKEDFHLSMENLTLLSFEDVSDNEDNAIALEKSFHSDDTYDINKDEEENISTSDQDDTFGEILFNEDLENGLYCLETYNADGKELIMCIVHIDRKSVDLNSFDKLKSQSGLNVLTNYDKTLVLMEGADTNSINESKSGSDSKRTTIYSTTSGDSYDDEGIDIENASSSYGYSAARRETYCDNQGVVRIERVVPYSETPEEPPDYLSTKNNYYYSSQEEPVNDEEENYYESISLEHEIMFSMPKVKKETLHYIVEEIKSTERKYIADMKKVLTEYKGFLADRCPEKVDIVFSNMDQICRLQLRFLQTLEESGTDVKRVVQAFIDSEDLFRLYPRYFKNTPKANAAVKELSFLIKEKQDRINDKLDLSAYLLTPLQRLGKYKLFLENIIKQLEKEQKPIGAVQMALDIIKKYMSKGNDAVAIASILRSPLHTKDYGSFISREKFLLLKPKRQELMVFLFEGVVVFTTEDPKNMEQFEYYKSIKTNDLRIATFDDTTIHLTDFTKTKKRNSSKYTLILDAKTLKLKSSWKQQIEDILWKQMKKIKENTLKEYQTGNKTPKKATRSREQRSKSTGSSTFYID